MDGFLRKPDGFHRASTPVVILFTFGVIPYEERQLEALFGDEYREYKKAQEHHGHRWEYANQQSLAHSFSGGFPSLFRREPGIPLARFPSSSFCARIHCFVLLGRVALSAYHVSI
jgi:hypothetical protein